LVTSLLRTSTTPNAATTFTALSAHSHLQAALQLIQGAGSSPSAASVSGTYAVCGAARTHERKHVGFPTSVCPNMPPPLQPSRPHETHPSSDFPPLADPYTSPVVAQSVHRASLPDPDSADLTGTGDKVRVVTQHTNKNDGPAITNYVEISLSTKEGMCGMWGQEGLLAS
jgi:hypothetical protein